MSRRHSSLLTLLSKGKNFSHNLPNTISTSTEVTRFDYVGLPGLRTLCEPEITTDDRIIIRTEQSEHLSRCSHCGAALKRNGTRPQVVRDEPRGLRSVWIEIRRQSYICTAETCGKPVQQPLHDVHERRRMTTRLIRYVQESALLDKFQMVALRTGLSVRTVREIFQEHVDSLDKTFQFKTPRVLGLDGIHIERGDADGGSKPEGEHRNQENRDRLSRLERGVLTDIEAGQVLNVRTNCSKDEMVQGIEEIPGHEKIEVAVIDMSLALRNAVRKALPQAVIVIDRFHVQKYASDCIDNVRKRLRKQAEVKQAEVKLGGSVMCDKDLLRKHWNKLSPEEQENLQGWFRHLPELGLAYETKEAYFELWNSPSSGIARQRYQRWLDQLPPELGVDFRPLLSVMKNWGDYIFNYFDHRYTNAFTEQANRQIRDILRASRTCGFKTYRAKVVYGTMVKKQMEERRKMWAGGKGRHRLTGRKRRCDARPTKAKKIRLLPTPPPMQISLLGNSHVQDSM